MSFYSKNRPDCLATNSWKKVFTEKMVANQTRKVFVFTNQPIVFFVHFGLIICLALIEFHLNWTDWQLCYVRANQTNTLSCVLYIFMLWIIYVERTAVQKKKNK